LWLLGTKSTAHWGFGLFDVTNQYVLEGVRGGLLTLVLFVAIVVTAYAYAGRLVRVAEGSRARLAQAWAVGTTLFVHCTIFIAVSYFGQIIMLWYLLLAAIAGLAPPATALAPARRPVTRGRSAPRRSALRHGPAVAWTHAARRARFPRSAPPGNSRRPGEAPDF